MDDLLTVAELRPYFDAAGIPHLDSAYKSYALRKAQQALAEKDELIAQLQRTIMAMQQEQLQPVPNGVHE